VGGTNADITINGIPYASTTNTVTGAIPDVTLSLVSADSATPVTVTVGPDTTSITNSINNFVTEYNTVIGDINTQFTINPSTSLEGPLGSDTDLRVLQSSLASDITYATTDSTSVSSGFTNLAALGITMNDDGTLSVDSSTLSTALSSNPAAVQNFFTNSNSTGFADNMNADLTNLTDPAEGILNEDLASNQQQQTDLTNEITDFQTQLAAQQTALTQEFDQVNANLEEYPFTLAEVNAALGSLSSSSATTSTTPTTNTNTTPTSGTSASGSSSTSSTSGSGS
jgi:flagellar hook-associated protein 2